MMSDCSAFCYLVWVLKNMNLQCVNPTSHGPTLSTMASAILKLSKRSNKNNLSVWCFGLSISVTELVPLVTLDGDISHKILPLGKGSPPRFWESMNAQ